MTAGHDTLLPGDAAAIDRAPPKGYASGLIDDAQRRTSSLLYGWPVILLVGGLGFWWALGISGLSVHVFALFMLVHLVRARRSLVAPFGIGLWTVYLVWSLAGLSMLRYNPPGTVDGGDSGQLLSVAYDVSSYVAATIVLVYVANLDIARFPTRRLVRLLGVAFLWVVAGGLLGMLLPYFEFTSPVEALLPEAMRSNVFVRSLVHPAAAQVQDFLGYDSPRPAAPFGFTNMWGHNYALLLGFGVVAFIVLQRGGRRVLGTVLLAVSLIPAFASLNRGLWIGLGFALIYGVIRLALSGRLRLALASALAVLLTAGLLLASPLGHLAGERLDNGHSNNVRAYTITGAFDVSQYSPVIGFGNTRTAEGSPRSLAIGKSPTCPRCGNFPIGINGQFWFEIVAHGYVGLALYVTFWLRALWRYRRDSSPEGIAAGLALSMMLVLGFVYGALPTPLAFALIAYALLDRRDRLDRRNRQEVSLSPPPRAGHPDLAYIPGVVR